MTRLRSEPVRSRAEGVKVWNRPCLPLIGAIGECSKVPPIPVIAQHQPARSGG